VAAGISLLRGPRGELGHLGRRPRLGRAAPFRRQEAPADAGGSSSWLQGRRGEGVVRSRCGGCPVGLRSDLKTVARACAVPIPMPPDLASPDLVFRRSVRGWGFGRGKPLAGGGGHGVKGAPGALLGGDAEVQPYPLPPSSRVKT
jgi:hypothetical protein